MAFTHQAHPTRTNNDPHTPNRINQQSACFQVERGGFSKDFTYQSYHNPPIHLSFDELIMSSPEGDENITAG